MLAIRGLHSVVSSSPASSSGTSSARSRSCPLSTSSANSLFSTSAASATASDTPNTDTTEAATLHHLRDLLERLADAGLILVVVGGVHCTTTRQVQGHNLILRLEDRH